MLVGDAPSVLRNALGLAWRLDLWTPAAMHRELGSTEIDVRLTPNAPGRGLREGDSEQFRCRLEELLDWMQMTPAPASTSTASGFADKKYGEWWAYASYMYVSELWRDRPEVRQRLAWDELGLDTRHENSAMWIGSAGAFTPCHYDVYGYNVAVQLSGHKTWWFYPPSQSALLYPCRLPYEESTVFSNVHPLEPDLERFPRFAEAQPISFTVGPGDVLVIPRHWWHFVRCDDLSVSVNQWFEMPTEDAQARVGEAITRYLVATLYRATNGCLQTVEHTRVLNLNESFDNTDEDDWELLVQAHTAITEPNSGAKTERPSKRKKREEDEDSDEGDDNDHNDSKQADSERLALALAHACSHPAVIDHVRQQMDEYLRLYSPPTSGT